MADAERQRERGGPGRRTATWLLLGVWVAALLAAGFAGRAPAALLAAHRGGAGLWPENSLLAFRSALALGVDFLELDVHLTRDDRLVVIHDPTLERTTTGIGAVRGATLEELRAHRLRDGGAERIPTLEEVLDLVHPTETGLLLEIKTAPRREPYPGIEDRVLRLLRARGLVPRTVVMSFEPSIVRRVRELDPTIRTSLVVSARRLGREGAVPAAAVAWAVDAGATDIGIQHTLITPALVAAARARGLRIGAWTVNDEAAMRRMIDFGVDVLITDWPDLARTLLSGR
jgi:glycerophosphoryl diester phosphodiesterase